MLIKRRPVGLFSPSSYDIVITSREVQPERNDADEPRQCRQEITEQRGPRFSPSTRTPQTVAPRLRPILVVTGGTFCAFSGGTVGDGGVAHTVHAGRVHHLFDTTL